MQKEIMVIDTDTLLWSSYFQWFSSHNLNDFASLIDKHHQYKVRWPMEEDPNFKQPIVYAVTVDPKTNKVFAFQRGVKSTESRLHGNRCRGVWWHIDKDESIIDNIIVTNLEREIEEEIGMKDNYSTSILGYINDDSNEVGQVHFGIVFVVELDHTQIQSDGIEIEKGDFYHIDELEKKVVEWNVENWSTLILPAIKKHLIS